MRLAFASGSSPMDYRPDGVLWATIASLGMISGVLALSLGRSLWRERLLRKKAEQLGQLAMTDALTGLANRRYFHERLTQSLALARRQDLKLALVLVDLDDFKGVNDRHGHLTGDHVLKAVARELETDKRAEDLVVRHGGEEFAVLLEGTDSVGALVRAERLRQRLHGLELRAISGSIIRVTASFGVAAFPDTSAPRSEDLIADADRALYLAKATGRDRCQVAPQRGEAWPGTEAGRVIGQGASLIDSHGKITGAGASGSDTSRQTRVLARTEHDES